MVEIAVYFKIDKAAKMAVDLDTDEPAGAYTKVGFGHREAPVTQEEYENLVPIAKKLLRTTAGIAEEHITPISEAEYLDNTEEEGEE